MYCTGNYRHLPAILLLFYFIICFWLSAAVSDHALTWSGSTPQLDTIKDCSKCWSVELCCWPESRAFILGSVKHFVLYSACTMVCLDLAVSYTIQVNLCLLRVWWGLLVYGCRVSKPSVVTQSTSLQLVQIWLYYSLLHINKGNERVFCMALTRIIKLFNTRY